MSDNMVDLAFAIECRALPLDHAHALSRAIHQLLPWFANQPEAGLHLIHGAESGNGWQRPEEADALLYLSRRTRLTLRLPREWVEQAKKLNGQTLDINGYPLKIGKATEKPLTRASILFARHVRADPAQSEEDFLRETRQNMKEMGINCRKMLCGKTAAFQLPDGKLFTRSLLLADLEPADSLLLQQQGLGEGRKIGCGLFVPHKALGGGAPREED